METVWFISVSIQRVWIKLVTQCKFINTTKKVKGRYNLDVVIIFEKIKYKKL